VIELLRPKNLTAGLQAVANFGAPTTITVRCAGSLGFSGQSDNNVLTALKVGAIH
jgi:hypothetical protein